MKTVAEIVLSIVMMLLLEVVWPWWSAQSQGPATPIPQIASVDKTISENAMATSRYAHGFDHGFD